MPEEGKTTIQVYDLIKDRMDRLWVTNLKFEEYGVWCSERSQLDYEIFIPYGSIRMITKPKE